MVSIRSLAAFLSSLLILEAGNLVSATPASASILEIRQNCAGVAPSPGGQPCSGTDVLTCIDVNTWSCPDGDTGVVPPGTQCICNAFRQPGWIPNSALPNQDGTLCTSGIVCVVEGGTQFQVCGVSGLEAPQDVPPGTVCRNGGITWP